MEPFQAYFRDGVPCQDRRRCWQGTLCWKLDNSPMWDTTSTLAAPICSQVGGFPRPPQVRTRRRVTVACRTEGVTCIFRAARNGRALQTLMETAGPDLEFTGGHCIASAAAEHRISGSHSAYHQAPTSAMPRAMKVCQAPVAPLLDVRRAIYSAALSLSTAPSDVGVF